jgi:hypothetical protein
MGYGEYGGGGSVHWLIDADDVDETTERGRMVGSVRRGSSREWRQHGIDYRGKSDELGRNFTIRVKLPSDRKERTEFIKKLKGQLTRSSDVLEFELPIEAGQDPHTQIQICWGKTPTWQDLLYELREELQGRPSSQGLMAANKE